MALGAKLAKCLGSGLDLFEMTRDDNVVGVKLVDYRQPSTVRP